MIAELKSRVYQCLTQLHPGPEPLALGYSGGGDSHALLMLAADWARGHGVTLQALIVDHGLRAESRAEAEIAAAAARELGVTAKILTWTGDKPATGLQSAARQARHTLLAEACATGGIRDLLLAHTLDDQAETLWMRLQAGGGWRSCAGMGPRSPSPIWPAGRSTTILRPLLAERRDVLRQFLAASGARWIEDPSNGDRRYARIRARQKLSALEAAGFQPRALCRWAEDLAAIRAVERRTIAALGRAAVRFHGWGGAELDVQAISRAAPVIRHGLIEAVAMAVAGAASSPRRAAIDRLDRALFSGGTTCAAGVQAQVWRGRQWMFKDAGAVLGRVDRRVDKRLPLAEKTPQIWDGRYRIETSLGNIIAEPLGKDYKGLPDRRLLDAVPGAARSGLLALRRAEVVIAIAGIETPDGLSLEPLIEYRYCRHLQCEAPKRGKVTQAVPAH